MNQLKFKEWDYNTREYSRTATVKTNKPEEKSARKLQRFEKYFSLIPKVFARSLQGQKSVLKSIERRTKRIGRINLGYVQNELIRAHAGQDLTQKIYDKRNNQARLKYKNQFAIGMLLDMSGSTRFEVDNNFTRIDLIKYSTIAIGRVLNTLDEKLSVWGYHSHESSNPTIMEKLKTQDEKWDQTIEEKIAAIEHSAETKYYNNKDGAAIRYANQALLDQNNKHKYMILVTDGFPNCDDAYYQGQIAFQDTAKAMEEGFKDGIRYIYLTINPDDTNEFLSTIHSFCDFSKQFKNQKELIEGLPLAYEKILKQK